MLVAFSIFAVSLSFLVYRHPPSAWIAWLSAPKTLPRGPPHDNSPRDDNPERPVVAKPKDTESEDQTDVRGLATSSPTPSPQTTPKAISRSPQNGIPIPTFTLADHESSDEEDRLPPPSFPSLNSAQRASAPRIAAPVAQKPSLMATPPMAPPPKPSMMPPPPRPAGSGLMPPPRIVPSNLRSLSTPSQALRVPTKGPVPIRGPVPDRSPNGGLSPNPTTGLAVKTPNARGKVLLSPGHSPLDWANLHQSGQNLSGVASLIRVPPSLLKHNNGRKGKPAWSSYQGKVYNITPYLPFHPGGEGELRRAAGKDGTKLFMEVHPWVNWDSMLSQTVVGILVSETQASQQAEGSLEEMD
ncbi:hypothetical protein K491DRAFT_702373 [Lophiostoma macrostomum CBS 122681]|uniref:Cytochrome b5 heme-binding domain-containing protein n=1 Tax=Lophiostoma macrostomum CBS 122681 TaxID=1314788 RepID=A0A6A6TIS6_9PLEO|nr:hypothetical protein K491DRAFT_702373 [Lophiostoma macrostomum CBS 122681]